VVKLERRLDRFAAQHTQRPTKPAETKLVIPNIIDFVADKDYLNQPNLYPRQALLLKLICLSPELLSAYDHRVLEQWGAGFTAVGEPAPAAMPARKGCRPTFCSGWNYAARRAAAGSTRWFSSWGDGPARAT